VEKPLALTEEEGRTIITEAERAGVVLLVGHTLRFDPRYVAARQAIQEGRIGDLIHAYTRRNAHIDTVRRYGDRVSVAFFLGIHDIDFLLWATGASVTRVTAEGRRGHLTAQGLDLHDTIFSLLTFDNGLLACVENAWCVPDAPGRMYSQLFEAQGTEGEIHIVPEETGLTVRGPGFLDHPSAVYEPIVTDRLGGAYRDEIEHFIDCVTEGMTPIAPGHEAIRAVAVVHAIHRSLEAGEPVEMG
jgi:myo-inositol 2-dehydrogenase/D-chiro-inositol 1-dehydrogenase